MCVCVLLYWIASDSRAIRLSCQPISEKSYQVGETTSIIQERLLHKSECSVRQNRRCCCCCCCCTGRCWLSPTYICMHHFHFVLATAYNRERDKWSNEANKRPCTSFLVFFHLAYINIDCLVTELCVVSLCVISIHSAIAWEYLINNYVRQFTSWMSQTWIYPMRSIRIAQKGTILSKAGGQSWNRFLELDISRNSHICIKLLLNNKKRVKKYRNSWFN